LTNFGKNWFNPRKLVLNQADFVQLPLRERLGGGGWHTQQALIKRSQGHGQSEEAYSFAQEDRDESRQAVAEESRS
jgi:hypothetical protein